MALEIVEFRFLLLPGALVRARYNNAFEIMTRSELAPATESIADESPKGIAPWYRPMTCHDIVVRIVGKVDFGGSLTTTFFFPELVE